MAGERGVHRDAVDTWLSRRRASLGPTSWRFDRLLPAIERVAEEAEGAGVLDPSLLDDFGDLVVATLSAELGRVDASARALGTSLGSVLLDGKLYRNRLDRQMAVGASAVACLASEEAAFVVVSEVVRRLVLADGSLSPAYPSRAVVDEGEGAAEAAEAEARAEAAGVAGS